MRAALEALPSREAVRGALTIGTLLRSADFELRPSSGGYRSDSCPWCGSGHRGKLCIQEQVCFCHSCTRSGDIFDVAGALCGLHPSRDFPEILRRCAAIAGIGLSQDTNHDELVRRQKSRRAKEEKQRSLTQRRAEQRAAMIWDGLPVLNETGKAYLRSRGLVANTECRSRPNAVCLPLYRGANVSNVVSRRVDNTQPKIVGLSRCRTQGTFGQAVVQEFHRGPIVVVEGFVDYLTARQQSPTQLVLGAHGAHNLPYVAQVAAKLVGGSIPGIVLVHHQDDAGHRGMAKARSAAIEAGLADENISDYYVANGCNDLNDELTRKRRAI